MKFHSRLRALCNRPERLTEFSISHYVAENGRYGSTVSWCAHAVEGDDIGLRVVDFQEYACGRLGALTYVLS